VPFYDHSLVGIKLNKSLSRPTSPEPNQSHSCMCNSLNETELMFGDLSSNLISNKVNTENTLSNLDDKNLSLNNLINTNTYSTIYRKDELASSKPSSYLICSKCNLKQSFIPYLNARINQRELTLKSYSNGNFNCIKRLDASFYKSPTTQTSCLLNSKRLNEKSHLNFSFSNKLKSQHHHCNHSWGRYCSNGLIFPNSFFNVGSNLLSKSYLTSNKSSYNSVNLKNARAKSSSTTSTIPIVNLPSQHISELNLINENKIYDDKSDSTVRITNRRSILRNKHYNLMSLDENALYSYRKQHRINQLEHQNKMKKKLLIAKTNLSVISANSTTLTSTNIDADELNAPLNETINFRETPTSTLSSITSSLMPNKTIQFKSRTKAALSSLVSPHGNFISLCSGPDPSDTSNKNKNNNNTNSYTNINSNNNASIKNKKLIDKIGVSYDYDNADFNDTSPDLSPRKQLSRLFNQKSSSNLQNSIPLKNISTTMKNPYTYEISPKTQMASMRRKMFVDSRRMAQTNVDYANLSSKCEDSVYSDSNFDLFASMSNYNQYDNSNSNVNLNTSLNTNSVVINETKNTVVESESKNNSIAEENDESDSNLLNPSWIPLIVQKALLDIHDRAVLSKSESNIRNRYRSSNHLLHSPTSKNNNNNTNNNSNTNCATSNNASSTIKPNSILKSSKKKKSLSLQNSRDKSMYISIDQKESITPNQNINNHPSYLHNFHELRAKLFQNKTSNNTSKPQHQQSKDQSEQQPSQQDSFTTSDNILLENSIDKSSAKSSFDNSNISANESSSQSNATIVLNPNYQEK
jgi:hypothetical protein